MPGFSSLRPCSGLLLFLLAAGGPLAAGTPAKAPKPLPAPVKVTTVEGFTEYQLANGLRVLLFPDPSKPTITVNLTYLVGSRHENYGETGMAHLLEHLMFKGSSRHRDLNTEMTERGARNNASTSYDRTNYFEIIPATEANLAWALDMEADRMVHAFIAQKDLWNPVTKQGEMTVVRNEFEQGENNPAEVLEERVQGAAYHWHNYAKSTIGCKADIENVDEARLQAFYHTYYQPDNAVLLVTGNLDEAKTLALVNRDFGAIPRPARKLRKTYTMDPVQDGEHQVVVRRVGDVQWSMAGYHVPAGSDPDTAAVSVLEQVLGGSPAGRLHKALVDTKKSTEIISGMDQVMEPGFLLFGAKVRPEGNLDEVKDLFLRTLEDPAAMTFTQEEVDRARGQILKGVDLALNDATRVGLAMSEAIAMGDWRLFFLNRDRVKAVTPADVSRVAHAYLKSSNRTLGLFIPTPRPDRAEVPPVADVAAMVKDYKGQAAVARGEAFDPAPAAIEARTLRFTTPSGLKAAFIPKKSRGASVAFRLNLRLGDLKGLTDKDTAGDLAARMLMRGTAHHTRTQISELLDKKKAVLRMFGGAESLQVMGETNRENLPDVLRLATEILREAAFPADEFEILKQETLAQLEEQRNEPRAVARLELSRHLDAHYPVGHPRHAMTLDEQAAAVKAARVEDAKGFWSAFYGAGDGELAMVGDFDAKETRALVEELLGAWRSPSPYVRIPSEFHEPAGFERSLETPDKANAVYMVGLPLALQDTDPDYPALVLGDFMLGSSGSSRLWTRIREKEGLSYGVYSRLQASSRDRAGIWSVSAIHAPENLGRLDTAFKEEVARALKDGFTPEELKAAKSGWLQNQSTARTNDGNLAGVEAANVGLGRTLAYNADLEKKVAALTNDQIVAALRKHLDASKFAYVKAGAFAKK